MALLVFDFDFCRMNGLADTDSGGTPVTQLNMIRQDGLPALCAHQLHHHRKRADSRRIQQRRRTSVGAGSHGPLRQLATVRGQRTHLHRVLVVIDLDKNWYTRHACCSAKGFGVTTLVVNPGATSLYTYPGDSTVEPPSARGCFTSSNNA